MVKGYYSLLIKELKRMGYAYDRNAQGSHERWVKDAVSVIVPRNLNSRHTANDILREAGSTVKF